MDRYIHLSEDKLFEKIDDIQKKLMAAYSTSVGQEYIDFLQSQIDLIQTVIEEKEFMKQADTKNGVYMDTYNPDEYFEETIKQEKEEKRIEEKMEIKKSNLSKFVKIYKNED